MNWRLLTEYEKRYFAHGRYVRAKQRRRRKRRESLLAALADCLGGAAAMENITKPEEAFALGFGHLNASKRIAQRLAWQAAAQRHPYLPANCPASPLVNLPMRTLRSSKRIAVDPNLVPERMSPQDQDEPILTLPAAIQAVREAKDRGATPPHLLDKLAALASISFEVAAILLLKEGLIAEAMTPIEIDAVRAARSFWNQYAEGQLLYAAAVRLGHVVRVGGEFALFEMHQISDLLPGIRIPKRLRRQDYALTLVRNPQGRVMALDFFGLGLMTPLFRVPFTRSCDSGEPQRSTT